MEVLEIVERVGAYAGLAAVLGLAVLATLYFSQARDLKRLREWAGRAPERTSPPVRPVAPGSPPRVPTAPRGAPLRGAGAATAGAGAGSTSAAATSAGAATGTSPDAAQSGAAPAVSAPPSGGGGPEGNGGPEAPEEAERPLPPPPSRTQIRGPAARPGPPGAKGPRRIAPRYLALIVAGILIVGAAVSYGIVQYTGSEAPVATAPTRPATRPVVPAEVTVSVLNGTTTAGLAAQIGDSLEAGGFRLGNVTNATEQQRAESAILYVPGADREARVVGRRLRIDQIERADARDRVLAGTARVIVVVGADQAR